jgi:DNA-binding NarL/FixJ family response regulator
MGQTTWRPRYVVRGPGPQPDQRENPRSFPTFPEARCGPALAWLGIRPMTKPRVSIADDYTLLTEALEKLLASECEVVGKVTVGSEMPSLDGLDAAHLIRQRDPSVKLLFVAVTEDSDVAARACRAGASTYVLKRSTTDESAQPSLALTTRQREVLQLLAEGKCMKEVAGILNVTPRTVAFHKYRMMERLKIKTNAELIQFAVRHHLV